ncbi:thiol reductase thioredoxin [Catellatospora sp. TT07R-123]|uniref:thioredoxin n=1 Tax=Catellatospora sp. TT07R-123 TaxID=2733863 RepID=UPI001B0945C2|nr:thioredoxin [Catellatospora sp. TT07R-123]GHJ47511.1 thiol reductase thioredoxin [Catellatospora sp. TT07R-123]
MADSPITACPHCGTRNRVPAAAKGLPRCGKCQELLPWLTDATDADFTEIVEQSALPVLMDLWAPWCGPCRVVAPGVARAAEAYAGRLKVVKVNVDIAQQTAVRYQAQSIPLLLLLDKGAVRARQVGAVPTDALLRWVDQSLALSPAA